MTTGHSHDGPAAPSSQESYWQTVRRLSTAQKPPTSGTPLYTPYVNRPIGRLFAAAAYRRGMVPNQVTALSAAFSFVGIALVATQAPSLWLGLGVFALLQIGYALDSADGMLARLRGGGSSSGEWLDHVIDSLKISSLHMAVLVLAYRHLELASPALLLVPIVFAVVAAVAFFAQTLNDQLRRAHAARTGGAAATAGGSWLRRALVTPTDYGVLVVTFALLGAPMVFFWVYAALGAALAGHTALALPKWFGDMRRLDAASAAAGAGAPR